MSTRDLIDAIEAGSTAQIQQHFQDAIVGRVAEKLDQMRLEVGRTMFNQSVNEEVEQIDELSKDTLMSYVNKVSADSQKHPQDPTKRSPEKANRSVAGFAKAYNKLTKEEVELDEGTLMVSRHRNYARPGQGPESHQITKDHGEAPDGSHVYSVKQPNGYHGVLAVKDQTIVGSSQNNLSKDKAHAMGDHYAKHGTTGIGVGKDWHLGSGIYGKVVKQDF